jgi:uncharacterized protein (DUF608 family)
MSKKFKTNISIPFPILFYKILHSYNNLFSSNEDIFKYHIHSHTNQKKIKQFLKKGLHITWLPMWFNMHINVKKPFHMNYHMWVNAIIIYESMHINWNYDQNKIKLLNTTIKKILNLTLR